MARKRGKYSEKKRRTRKGYKGRGGGILDWFGLGKSSKVAPMDPGMPAVESKNLSKTLPSTAESQNQKPTIQVKTENNENPQSLESVKTNNRISEGEPRTPSPNTPLTPKRITAKRINLTPRQASAQITFNKGRLNTGSLATNLKPSGSVLNIKKLNNARRSTNIYNTSRNRRLSTEYIKRNPNNNRRTLKKVNRGNIGNKGNNMSITPVMNFL